MEQQLSKVGLRGDPRVTFFTAIKKDHPGPFLRTGSHGAFLSHLEILKSQRGLDATVLILQDDCDFVPDVLSTSVQTDWDILYGGYHELDPTDLQNSDIIGAHCMAFRPRVIGPLVDFLEDVYSGDIATQDANGGSPEAQWIAPPIDGAIVWFRRLHPNFKTQFQKVSYQRSSRTDIGQRRPLDRIPVPFLANFVRFFLRRYRRLKAK